MNPYISFAEAVKAVLPTAAGFVEPVRLRLESLHDCTEHLFKLNRALDHRRDQRRGRQGRRFDCEVVFLERSCRWNSFHPAR